MKIKSADRGDLKRAKLLLENPGLAAKISDALGTPIEKGFEKLPEKWNSMIGDLTQTALTKTVQVAVFTIGVSNHLPRWICWSHALTIQWMNW